LAVGRYGIRPGAMMAGCAFFDIRVQGKGGHGARPANTVDPVVCGAQIVSALQTVVSRNVPSMEAAVLSITGFDAGKAYNVIPERVALRGTVRAFRAETMRLVEARMRALAESIAAGFGAAGALDFREVTIPVVNAPEQTAIFADAAASLVGEDGVERDRPAVMGSEDFAYMLAERPGAYIVTGNGVVEDEGGTEVHHPRYDFNDAAIPYGAGVLAAVAERELPSVSEAPPAP
jgi:amidohydrolase